MLCGWRLSKWVMLNRQMYYCVHFFFQEARNLRDLLKGTKAKGNVNLYLHFLKSNNGLKLIKLHHLPLPKSSKLREDFDLSVQVACIFN